MNITEIKNPSVNTLEYKKYIPLNADKMADNTSKANIPNKGEIIISDKNDILKPKNWNQEILLQGLNFLENNIQMFNNGSILDKEENRPIESFAEAMKELDYIKAELFKNDLAKQQTSVAQSNVSPATVYELLTTN